MSKGGERKRHEFFCMECFLSKLVSVRGEESKWNGFCRGEGEIAWFYVSPYHPLLFVGGVIAMQHFCNLVGRQGAGRGARNWECEYFCLLWVTSYAHFAKQWGRVHFAIGACCFRQLSLYHHTRISYKPLSPFYENEYETNITHDNSHQ